MEDFNKTLLNAYRQLNDRQKNLLIQYVKAIKENDEEKQKKLIEIAREGA